MSDVDKLHYHWKQNKTSLSDAIMEGLNAFFKRFRKKSTDPIFSIGEIDLPFPASKEIKLERVGDRAGARLIHAFLTALESSDHEDHDKDDDFDII